MLVEEMIYFGGNQMPDSINTSNLWWIVTPKAAWAPPIFMVTVEWQPQLLLAMPAEATKLTNMILTESGLDFLGAPVIMGLNLGDHIREAVFMILAHAITNLRFILLLPGSSEPAYKLGRV